MVEPIQLDEHPTGIPGLDKIPQGGLPAARTMLIRWGQKSAKGDFSLQTLSNRRLRKIESPGPTYGLNEHTFTIGTEMVMTPFSISLKRLHQKASREKVSTGVSKLDDLFDGGMLRAIRVLIAGPPGIGKTSLADTFAESGCSRDAAKRRKS